MCDPFLEDEDFEFDEFDEYEDEDAAVDDPMRFQPLCDECGCQVDDSYHCPLCGKLHN